MRSFLLLVVLAFVFPRLALLVWASGVPISDGKWYFERAVSIAGGRGYAFDGTLTAFWPVGYPGFLALLFLVFPASPEIGLIANFLLSAVTVLCSFQIFRRLRVGNTWAMLGTLVVAIYPTFLFYQNMLLSEILMMTLLYLSIMCLLWARRNYEFMFTGIVFGLAVLVKSQVLFLPMFVLIYDIWDGRAIKITIRKYVFLGIGVAISVFPWTLRNYLEFDRFVLVQSNAGYNLFAGNNPLNRWGSGMNADELAAHYPEIVSDITRPLSDEIAMNDRAAAAGLRFIAADPLRVLGRIPYKLYRFFRHDPLPFDWLPLSNAKAGRSVPWLPWLFQTSFWYHTVVVGCAMLSSIAFMVGPLRTRTHFILLCTIFYFALISAIFFGEGRFAVPLLPAFAGCMVVALHAAEWWLWRPALRRVVGFIG